MVCKLIGAGIQITERDELFFEYHGYGIWRACGLCFNEFSDGSLFRIRLRGIIPFTKLLMRFLLGEEWYLPD